MSLGERLRQARERKGLKQVDVCKRTGINNKTLSRYEKSGSEPDVDTLLILAELYEVSPNYLLKGDRKETSWNKEQLNKNGFFEGNFIMIPIVAEIACGQPIFTDDRIIGEFPADKSLINGGEYVWLRAKGESMIGANILDGSLVLIRLQPEVEAGEIAAVCIDFENATLKRVFYTDNKVTLMPDNPTMKPMTYSSDRIRVVGKAVFVGTRL